MRVHSDLLMFFDIPQDLNARSYRALLIDLVQSAFTLVVCTYVLLKP
jgi:hypothetical protein